MKKAKKCRLWVAVIACVAVVAVILTVCLLRNREKTEDTQLSDSFGTISDVQEVYIPSEKDLCIDRVGSYTGAYMEDGTDQVLSNILMIRVTNNGEKTLQYGEISLTDGETTAQFTLSTLPPGESAILLEQTKMTYDAGKNLQQVSLNNVAFFAEEPTLCQDRISVQALDGVINVTNISGTDISGDVVIYYKNWADGILYGGITYRIIVSGGIAAGETKQLGASHFSQSGSRILWVAVA